MDSAKKADVEIKEDMSDVDIMKAVIISVFPKSKERLDEKKDDLVYIQARFDAAVESIEDTDEQNAENRKLLNGDTKDPEVNSGEVINYQNARQKYIEDMKKDSLAVGGK